MRYSFETSCTSTPTMDQQTFHQLLEVVQFSKVSSEINAAEQRIVELRDGQQPELFLQLIQNEILDNNVRKEIQLTAIIILKNDLCKNGLQSSVIRAQDKAFVKQLFINLLQYLASNNIQQLCDLVSEYTIMQLQSDEQNNFPEVFMFIQQGIESNGETAILSCCRILRKLCDIDIEFIKNFPINTIEILCKFANYENGRIATDCIISLLEILESNDSYDRVPVIQNDVVAKIFELILKRVNDSFSHNYFGVKNQSDMLEAIQNLIYNNPDAIQQYLAHVIQLCQNVIGSNELESQVRVNAVNILSAIAESCNKLKRHAQQALLHIATQLLLPGAILPLEDTDYWLNTPIYDYENNDLITACSTAIGQFAFYLGKKTIWPIFKQAAQDFINNRNYYTENQILMLIQIFTEKISDVITQNDVNQFVDLALQCISSQHARVRYEAVNSISNITEYLEEKVIQHHAKIIPALASLCADAVRQVVVYTTNALAQYVEILEYDQAYIEQEAIMNIYRNISQSDQLVIRGNAASLLTALCTALGDEAESMLRETLPHITQQFNEVISALQQQNSELTKEQTMYIIQIIQLISTAVHECKGLFQSDEVGKNLAANFVFIFQRALQNNEQELFEQAITSLSTLSEDFGQAVSGIFTSIFPQLIEILKQKSEQQQNLIVEDDSVYTFNETIVQQQNMVLEFIYTYLDTNPQEAKPIFDQLTTEICTLNPFGQPMKYARLLCIAELIHVAHNCFARGIEFAENVFDMLLKGASQESCFVIDNVESALDVISRVIKYYVGAAIQIQPPNAMERITQLVNLAEALRQKALEIYQNLIEEAHELDHGDDEREAAMNESSNEIISAIESYGLFYEALLHGYNKKASNEFYAQVLNIAQCLLSLPIDNPANTAQVEEGAGILANLIKYTEKQQFTCIITNNIISNLIQIAINAKGGYKMIRCVYFTLAEYVKLTGDQSAISNQNLLNAAVQMLQKCEEDGSDEALGCSDNVVAYLTVAGFVGGQNDSFWNSMFQYMIKMKEDEEEIERVIEFLLEQQDNVLKNMKDHALTIVMVHYLGKHHSYLKKSNAGQKCAELARTRKDLLQAAARIADSAIVRKTLTKIQQE